MDVVLEVFDTFLFDRLYATVLPSSMVSYNRTIGFKNVNPTLSSMREIPTGLPAPSNFLFQLEPSEYAYMSAWPRENLWRQGLSLYLITW